ncbi:MAG: hypothetical protein XD95_0670, partial [Microgenomates bacterium 39_7]
MLSITHQKVLSYFLRTLMVFFAILILCIVLAATLTLHSFSSAKRYELGKATSYTKIARYPLEIANLLTLNRWDSLQAWKEGLLIVEEVSSLQNQINQSMQSFASGESQILTDENVNSLRKINQSMQSFLQAIDQSLIISRLLGKARINQIKTASPQLSEAINLFEIINTDELNWVFLLNNSDELRASGGFVGSLASATTTRGNIQNNLVFYDIYDLSNRIDRLEEAPIGVSKYLSEGKGLALTDANWEVDFTQSAKTLLSFLNQSELPSTDILVSLNLNLIQDLLKITGPIKLIDSQKVVSSQNLSTLAREDRLNFFQGDKQKKMFLTQLYQSLIQKLPELDQAQQLKLLKLLTKSFQQKQMIFYSPHPEIQQIFLEANISGAIDYQTDFFLYLLESNVGINKANQEVLRQVNLKFQPDSLLVKLEFENNNLPLSEQEKKLIEANPDLKQADHLGYVNYQRIVVNFPLNQAQIICNGDTIEPDETTRINTLQGEATQVGFLLTVGEQDKTDCVITLQPKTPFQPTQTWTVIKQPGLPITRYQLDYFSQETSFDLNQDIRISK